MKKLVIAINQAFWNYRDFGLLVFRLGIGCMFMWHGLPKVIGGEHKWFEIGQSMGTLGIHFAPAVWGLLAGCSEFFGGLFFALGLFYRPACILLIGDMSIAFISQMLEGKGLLKASQSFEDACSFVGALFVGPGRFSIDYYLGLTKANTESSASIAKG